MNGPTHMAFGAAFAAVYAGPVTHVLEPAVGLPAVPLWGVPICLMVGAVSGLLPDIDEPNAMLGRGSWMPRSLGPLFKLLGMIVSLPFRIAGFFIKGVLGHRGGTHSIAMSILFTLLFAIPITTFLGVSWDWLIWTIWFGFMSHLVADMLNPSGVPLFWPLRSKHKTVHLLPKPLRIPTQTPPNRREMVTRFGANAVVVGCVGLFCVLIPVMQQAA